MDSNPSVWTASCGSRYVEDGRVGPPDVGPVLPNHTAVTPDVGPVLLNHTAVTPDVLSARLEPNEDTRSATRGNGQEGDQSDNYQAENDSGGEEGQ